MSLVLVYVVALKEAFLFVVCVRRLCVDSYVGADGGQAGMRPILANPWVAQNESVGCIFCWILCLLGDI